MERIVGSSAYEEGATLSAFDGPLAKPERLRNVLLAEEGEEGMVRQNLHGGQHFFLPASCVTSISIEQSQQCSIKAPASLSRRR
jgi:hypothetical protein